MELRVLEYFLAVAREQSISAAAERERLPRTECIFAKAYGLCLSLDKLINTEGTDLCFRPLSPEQIIGMVLVWK